MEQRTTLLERVGSAIARSRFGGALLGDERRRTRAAFEAMREGYAVGPWQLPPEELQRQLRELDPYYLQDLVNQLGWDIIGGIGGLSILGSDAERQRAVESAERLFRYSPLAQFSVWLWSSWGLGDHVEITPTDEGAKEVVAEFLTAERNAPVLGDDHIKELSDWLLVTGNRFLVFFASEMDGEATMRVVEPEEMKEVVTDPQDSKVPWFYKREYKDGTATGKTIYYPDWQLYFSGKADEAWQQLVGSGKVKDGDERADRAASNGGEIGEAAAPGTGTVAVMMHVSFNRKERTSLWGWPLSTAAAPWLRTHKQYAQTRLTAAISVNSIIRRYQVSGGSRAVSSVRNTIASNLSRFDYLDTNPPPAPGTDEVINRAMDVEDLPLRTSAGDAKVDNDMFSWMALLGCGLFPISAGLDVARYATALQMDKAQSMLFEAYQTFWSAQFKRIVKIVLQFKEKFGNGKFKTLESEISIDSFSLSDFPEVARSLGQVVRDMLTPYAEAGLLDVDTVARVLQEAWHLVFQALGVNDPELVSDEVWGVAQPAPSEEGDVRAQLAAVVKENVAANPALREDALLLALAEIVEDG